MQMAGTSNWVICHLSVSYLNTVERRIICLSAMFFGRKKNLVMIQTWKKTSCNGVAYVTMMLLFAAKDVMVISTAKDATGCRRCLVLSCRCHEIEYPPN